jgi:hypothetical protein
VDNQPAALVEDEPVSKIRRERPSGVTRRPPLLDIRFVRLELARLAAPRRPGWPGAKRERRT